MTVPSALEALPRIRDDLRHVRRQRWRALAVYLLVFGLFVGFLWGRPAPGPGGSRDLSWHVGLVAMLVGAAASTGLAMGVPLVHGRRLGWSIGLAVTLMLGGLVAAVDFESPQGWTDHGPICFAVGTVISALFMIILGALSGRLWRRFPDPAALIAMGTTGVGIVALHLRCGNANPLHLLAFHVAPLAVLFVGARALTRLRLSLLDDDS